MLRSLNRISADVAATWFDAAMEGVVPCQVALNGEHPPTDATVSAHYGGDGGHQGYLVL